LIQFEPLNGAGEAGEETSGPRGQRSARSACPSPKREKRVKAKAEGEWRSSKRLGKGFVESSVDGGEGATGTGSTTGILEPVDVTIGSEVVELVLLNGVDLTVTVFITVPFAPPVLSSPQPKRQAKKSLITCCLVWDRKLYSTSSKTLPGSGLLNVSRAAAMSEVVGSSLDRAIGARVSSTW
jgi:hypothetical protein